MSTFDGIVAEFPDIRIDHFRPKPTSLTPSRPPLAYFLSHVHSDHLIGLENCRTFVYCSPATREIVLRLEKRFHRINFANGLLEARKQDYARLATVLKPIPIETPVEIELSPGNKITVTLFDANHCVGAVMFLIEGNDKTILYTGDIRSESWWLATLTRNPVLLPYVHLPGRLPIKQIDTIYLDTTFASKRDPYRTFPTKAEGIRELLEKVSQYSQDTIFYFDSWTFGYEDVWQALATFLGSKIHVDEYKYGLYSALSSAHEPRPAEAFKLISARCGNHAQDGILTTRLEPCRIHSCEQGTGCDILQKQFVRITPILSRHDGTEMLELGAGGGHGDTSEHRLEIEMDGKTLVDELMSYCQCQLGQAPELTAEVLQMLRAVTEQSDAGLTLSGEDYAYCNPDDLGIIDLIRALVNKTRRHKIMQQRSSTAMQAHALPSRITFPYSRHSSFSELCILIEAFKPRNIFPCTVDAKNWTSARSMAHLFGHLYDQPLICTHDQFMLQDVGRMAHESKRKGDEDANYGSNGSRDNSPSASQRRHYKRRKCKSSPAARPREVGDKKSDRTTFLEQAASDTSASAVPSVTEQNLTERGNSRDALVTNQSPSRERPDKENPVVSGLGIKKSEHHKMLQETHDEAMSDSFQPLSLDSVQAELALRQALHRAVSHSEDTWFDVGLVSVHGHQNDSQDL